MRGAAGGAGGGGGGDLPVVVLPLPAGPAVGGGGSVGAAVQVVAVLPLVAPWQVVDLVTPGFPVLVMIDQLLQLEVPGLQAARPEVFPQEARGPGDARVEPVQFPAGA